MEIELKLALQPRHMARIRRHPLLGKIKPQQRHLVSIYFDTPQFDLMRRGLALRVRRVGHQWLQTLKAEAQSVGALTSRPEWEMVIQDDSRPDFSLLPQTAQDLLVGIQYQQITPAFSTDFQRITWQINHNYSQVEVALDYGKIHAGDATQAICEVEIEFQQGAPEYLFDVAAQLLKQAPLHIEPRSKAERGYILSGAIAPAPSQAKPAALKKKQTVNMAFNAILQSALVQLAANVPGFLEQACNTEYLHQLRIALRRLQTSVLLAKSLYLIDPDWNQSLRELLHACNAARDWDVFLQETLPPLLGILNAPSAEASISSATQMQFDRTAKQARQQAQTLLQKPAFTQLMLDIGRSLLITPAELPRQKIKAWAETVLEKRWKNLRRCYQDFSQWDPSKHHRARLAAKKMRYAAEAFTSLYGKQSYPFITLLSTLQDELGHTNDLCTGVQLMRKLTKPSMAISFDVGRICGALELEIARHAHLSHNHWQQLKRAKLFWRYD